MTEKREKLEKLSDVSQTVYFQLSLGALSKEIGFPRRKCKEVLQILSAARTEVEVYKIGKTLKGTYHFGFRKFFKQEEKKKREIMEPHPDVHEFFVAVGNWLYAKFQSHEKAFGFVRGRNPKMAVEALLGKRDFLTFDINGAFPSVTEEMVRETLIKLNVNESVAETLAWMTTCQYQGKRCLPQGASSSPMLLNLVFKEMCEEIDRVCVRHGIDWVVYVDDFTSAAQQLSSEAKEELLSIPKKFGFAIKDEKTKENFGKTIPHMLGLTIVDDVIHIRHGRKNEYRRIFYEFLKYGKHSSAKIMGIANAIKCIYGEERNWPGWILQPWKECQSKMNGGGK